MTKKKKLGKKAMLRTRGGGANNPSADQANRLRTGLGATSGVRGGIRGGVRGAPVSG